ncbi:MAG TPA: metallophosphoesterase [Actinomycetes bacterium]|nr:metallophosphoesterase [Actinomycetes bacterium]
MTTGGRRGGTRRGRPRRRGPSQVPRTREDAIRIKVVSDIHGAAAGLGREAADADVLLVCGDLVNLLDYVTLDGPVTDVYGLDATRRFVELRTAGRFDEAGSALRAAVRGRERQARERVRADVRAQYERVFAAFPDRTLTLLTHGNVDSPELFADLLRPGVRHLDGETAELDGMTVGFVGGGLPRGSWQHLGERSEEAFTAKVAGLPPVDVLCSHMPPAIDDLCFDTVAGRPEPGSLALVEYVEEHQPDVLYFGHVHQPRTGRLRIGRTRLVNVGCFRHTGRMLVHPAT